MYVKASPLHRTLKKRTMGADVISAFNSAIGFYSTPQTTPAAISNTATVCGFLNGLFFSMNMDISSVWVVKIWKRFCDRFLNLFSNTSLPQLLIVLHP